MRFTKADGGVDTASDSPSIALSFASYFQSVFNPCPVPAFTPVLRTTATLDHLEVTAEQIIGTIKSLDPSWILIKVLERMAIPATL